MLSRWRLMPHAVEPPLSATVRRHGKSSRSGARLFVLLHVLSLARALHLGQCLDSAGVRRAIRVMRRATSRRRVAVGNASATLPARLQLLRLTYYRRWLQGLQHAGKHLRGCVRIAQLEENVSPVLEPLRQLRNLTLPSRLKVTLVEFECLQGGQVGAWQCRQLSVGVLFLAVPAALCTLPRCCSGGSERGLIRRLQQHVVRGVSLQI